MTKALAVDFLRVSAVAPEQRVANVEFNTAQMVAGIKAAANRGASLVLFPELSVTGYSCGDLFAQKVLFALAQEALVELAAAAGRHGIHAIVGLPWALDGRLYNCAAIVGDGRVLGLVPKQFLPTTCEYYEERWFTSGANIRGRDITLDNRPVPFGIDLLFADERSSCVFGVEICEDLWAVNPPSGNMCIAGANLILNPSASNELIGKAAYRRDLVRQQSARCLAAYAYAAAGPGESSTDVVFSGHCLISENGVMLAESERFLFDTQQVCADVDLHRLEHDRLCNSSFSAARSEPQMRRIGVRLNRPSGTTKPILLRPNPRHPFVPTNVHERADTCREIFSIQSTGLVKRLRHTGAKSVVVGISGGLDSTLALLVIVHAFDLMGLDRKGIVAPTMPGFGTTKRTRNNAEKLVERLGAALRVIPIKDAVHQHFHDIGHNPHQHDVTYENAQARERTQILMDVANQVGGFVVGTGDLSEAALGWCTFNGDHMSMYHVNIGIPKTLVRYLIEWCAEEEFSGAPSKILHDIAATPISPELLPTNHDGQQEQETEAVVGPYELHDFFLYHFVRHGASPAKILFLTEQAFADQYNRDTILHWMETFLRRFFAQQFKRSAMPDGPKVGSVALSPRGDWRMPSDASVQVWLDQVAALKPKTRLRRKRS